MARMSRGKLRHQIRIERPIADDAVDGAGSGRWKLVARPMANIQDVMPSRGENVSGGINMASRPARVRIHYREDITPDMRFVFGSRIMQIVAGPAEIGRKEWLEFMVEEYRPAGNPA